MNAIPNRAEHSSDPLTCLPEARVPEARVIVFEKTGQWAVALRRFLASGQRLHQTRSWDECWDELRASPASWVTLELTSGNLESVLSRLTRLGREFPSARAMIVGNRAMRAYEPLVREAGATCTLFSPRPAPLIARLMQRHLNQVPAP